MPKKTSVTLALLGFVVFAVLAGCAREEHTSKALPDRSKKLYSQYDEELVIRDYFDDRRGGFFLDVGSYHWRDYSTTYFLEKHLGWSGIAIDALEVFAEEYEEHRPRTKFFGYAVTDKSGQTLKLHLAFGASSLDPEWHKKFAPSREVQVVDVPTITLNDLLTKNRVTNIDFMSMDIEGAEPAALAGFDIENYMPKLVGIEATPENQETIAAYFKAHGYERIDEKRDTLNWYFRPRLAMTRQLRSRK